MVWSDQVIRYLRGFVENIFVVRKYEISLSKIEKIVHRLLFKRKVGLENKWVIIKKINH